MIKMCSAILTLETIILFLAYIDAITFKTREIMFLRARLHANKKCRVITLHFLFPLLYHVPCKEEILHKRKIVMKEIVANCW